ncbi:MAG TPA: hypothetical protein VMF87_18200, partial [Streptosporangiaceae bacterium]|nr:hypothetical protein [Streptosporangiaceae bacterium]
PVRPEAEPVRGADRPQRPDPERADSQRSDWNRPDPQRPEPRFPEHAAPPQTEPAEAARGQGSRWTGFPPPAEPENAGARVPDTQGERGAAEEPTVYAGDAGRADASRADASKDEASQADTDMDEASQASATNEATMAAVAAAAAALLSGAPSAKTAEPVPEAKPEPEPESKLTRPARAAAPAAAASQTIGGDGAEAAHRPTAGAAGPSDSPAVSEWAEAGAAGDKPLRDKATQVTVVPGITRYHRSECILIRFLGPEDLETMTIAAAEESGHVPCKACRPEQVLTGD